jgi:hypothetical protein
VKNLIVCFLLVSSLGFTQQGLTQSELEKARTLYIEMMESEGYKKKESLQEDFFPLVKGMNLRSLIDNGANINEEMFLEWINKNIAKENVESITKLFLELVELEKRVYDEYIEVFRLLNKATVDQAKEILEPFFKHTNEKYGY